MEESFVGEEVGVMRLRALEIIRKLEVIHQGLHLQKVVEVVGLLKELDENWRLRWVLFYPKKMASEKVDKALVPSVGEILDFYLKKNSEGVLFGDSIKSVMDAAEELSEVLGKDGKAESLVFRLRPLNGILVGSSSANYS